MIYHIVDADFNYSTLDIQNNALQIGWEFERCRNYYQHKEISMRYYFKKEDAIEYIRQDTMKIINKRKEEIDWLEWTNSILLKKLKQLEEL